MPLLAGTVYLRGLSFQQEDIAAASVKNVAVNVTALLSGSAVRSLDDGRERSVQQYAMPKCSPVILWSHNRIECFIIPGRSPKVLVIPVILCTAWHFYLSSPPPQPCLVVPCGMPSVAVALSSTTTYTARSCYLSAPRVLCTASCTMRVILCTTLMLDFYLFIFNGLHIT